MEYAPFYFVSHKGRAFVYREHYESSAEMNAAAFHVHKITGCYVCTDVRIKAPFLRFIEREELPPALHLVNSTGESAFAV